MKTSKGYSIVELMAVMAIIGILSAIALPNYRNYILRSKMMEVTSAAAPIQLAVAEALFDQIPIENITHDYLNIKAWEEHNQSIIKAITVTDGNINIEIDALKLGIKANTKKNRAHELSLTFTPYFKNDLLHWNCMTHSNIAHSNQYVPKLCKS